ncbi:MAG: type II/IV secretion system protein [Clostridia bacterium]|nr:type II/IV secretion system protein [Clostridia bacterium]
MNVNKDIMRYMVHYGAISEEKAATVLSAAAEANAFLPKYLIDKNVLSEVDVTDILAKYYGLPYIDIGLLDVDKDLLNEFTTGFLRKHKIVPVKRDKVNNTLIIAIAEPLNPIARSSIAHWHSGKISYIMVTESQIFGFIESIAAVKSTTTALTDLQSVTEENTEENTEGEETDVINAPAVRLVDSIIKEAIPFRASDIHIEPYEKKVRVRYRIDGDLVDRASFPRDYFPAITARIKILSGMNIAERRIPQDGRISMKVNNEDYDFRVSTMPTVNGEKFVIRVLDKSAFNFTRKELGFTDESDRVIDKMLAHPHGIILLTGPTGCGKSTTLYCFIKELNDDDVNIITVEDPVEYSMDGVNQTQVNTKANMTFATALRSILRQDPDIIMIGEVRDEETAEIAIRSAITGHLVFSTLHTNDAPGAIVRLKDMGVSGYLVADALVGVISQRLVKKLCPICKSEVVTTRSQMQMLGITEPATIYEKRGCQFCNNTGYKGRTAIHEIMYMNSALKMAANEERNLEEVRQLAIDSGMKTIEESARSCVLKGITTIEEMMTVITENQIVKGQDEFVVPEGEEE